MPDGSLAYSDPEFIDLSRRYLVKEKVLKPSMECFRLGLTSVRLREGIV